MMLLQQRTDQRRTAAIGWMEGGTVEAILKRHPARLLAKISRITITVGRIILDKTLIVIIIIIVVVGHGTAAVVCAVVIGFDRYGREAVG